MAPHDDLPTSLSTLALHADDVLNTESDVAPALHVSTTYRYTSDIDKLAPCNNGTVLSLSKSPGNS
jgi:cystathionine gamma-synthase